jgi:hypothetical protein
MNDTDTRDDLALDLDTKIDLLMQLDPDTVDPDLYDD